MWWELGSNEEHPQNFMPIRGPLGGDREFQKNARGCEVTADFLIEMAIDMVF